MKNIYLPDIEIDFNDLYFVCYMVERTARHLKQPNQYVVGKMTKQDFERQLSIAATNHCLNPLEVVDNWIEEYGLHPGTHDVTAVDGRFTDIAPSETQMGKVYARLVESTLQPGENYADGIIKVYASPICQTIDNYNASAYYEPSYVQTRAFYNGSF
ncbi:MAG: hypothetical protein HUK03_03350 [Bacteroidaceae bacterium]|nr:hypothetical protein [Bacteroidaceae bacterium]